MNQNGHEEVDLHDASFSAEWLLLETLRDLRNRVATATTPYEQLGISALIRKLIADSTKSAGPLIHTARRRTDLPTPTFEYTPFPIDTTRPDIVIALADEHFTVPTVSSDLEGFLAATAGSYGGTPVSVLMLNRYFANVHGGVHSGAPDTRSREFDRMLRGISTLPHLADWPLTRVLLPLGAVTARAFEPLERELGGPLPTVER